eukprot:g15038.t1
MSRSVGPTGGLLLAWSSLLPNAVADYVQIDAIALYTATSSGVLSGGTAEKPLLTDADAVPNGNNMPGNGNAASTCMSTPGAPLGWWDLTSKTDAPGATMEAVHLYARADCCDTRTSSAALEIYSTKQSSDAAAPDKKIADIGTIANTNNGGTIVELGAALPVYRLRLYHKVGETKMGGTNFFLVLCGFRGLVSPELLATTTTPTATTTTPTANYFDTGYEFDMTTASGTTLRVKYLGCYCDHPTRAMNEGPEAAAGGQLAEANGESSYGASAASHKPLPTSGTAQALVESYEYCAGLEDGKRTYFGVQNSMAAMCSNHVRAFTHQCFSGDEGQTGLRGKLPDAQCSRNLHGLPSNVNNGNGGGGGDWRNSIYMIAAPESCPSGYAKIDPIKPDLYGDVPKTNASPTKDADAVAADWAEDNQSTSEYEAEPLGYSPYQKVDADSVDKCGEKCKEDSDCAAMASDGISACFFYNADNLPTPYRTPGSFITCKGPPVEIADLHLLYTPTSSSVQSGGTAEKPLFPEVLESGERQFYGNNLPGINARSTCMATNSEAFAWWDLFTSKTEAPGATMEAVHLYSRFWKGAHTSNAALEIFSTKQSSDAGAPDKKIADIGEIASAPHLGDGTTIELGAALPVYRLILYHRGGETVTQDRHALYLCGFRGLVSPELLPTSTTTTTTTITTTTIRLGFSSKNLCPFYKTLDAVAAFTPDFSACNSCTSPASNALLATGATPVGDTTSAATTCAHTSVGSNYWWEITSKTDEPGLSMDALRLYNFDVVDDDDDRLNHAKVMVYSSKASSVADDADFIVADVGMVPSASDGGKFIDLEGRRPVYRLRVQRPGNGALAFCGFQALQAADYPRCKQMDVQTAFTPDFSAARLDGRLEASNALLAMGATPAGEWDTWTCTQTRHSVSNNWWDTTSKTDDPGLSMDAVRLYNFNQDDMRARLNHAKVMVYSSKASSVADDADFTVADVGKVSSAADGGTLVDLQGRRPVYRLRVQQPATIHLALCGFEALQFRLQPYTLNHLLRARFDEEPPTSPGLAHRPLQFRTGESTTWEDGTGHHCASSAGTARTGDPPYFYEVSFIDGVAREVDWIRVWNQKDANTPERLAGTEFYVNDDAVKLFLLPGFIGAEGAGDTGETGTLLKVGRTLTRFRIQGMTAPNKAVHLCGIHVYGPGEIPTFQPGTLNHLVTSSMNSEGVVHSPSGRSHEYTYGMTTRKGARSNRLTFTAAGYGGPKQWVEFAFTDGRRRYVEGVTLFNTHSTATGNNNKANWKVFYIDGGSTELVGAVNAKGAKGDKGKWVEIAKKLEKVRIQSDHNSNQVCLGGILIHGNPAPFRPLEPTNTNTTVSVARFLPKKTFLTRCAARNESLATPPAGAHADFPERRIKPAYAGGPGSPGGSEDPSKILTMKMPRQNEVDAYDTKYPHIGFGVPGAGTGPGGRADTAPHYGGVLHLAVGSELYFHGTTNGLMRMTEPVTTLNQHTPFAQRFPADPLPVGATASAAGNCIETRDDYGDTPYINLIFSKNATKFVTMVRVFNVLKADGDSSHGGINQDRTDGLKQGRLHADDISLGSLDPNHQPATNLAGGSVAELEKLYPSYDPSRTEHGMATIPVMRKVQRLSLTMEPGSSGPLRLCGLQIFVRPEDDNIITDSDLPLLNKLSSTDYAAPGDPFFVTKFMRINKATGKMMDVKVAGKGNMTGVTHDHALPPLLADISHGVAASSPVAALANFGGEDSDSDETRTHRFKLTGRLLGLRVQLRWRDQGWGEKRGAVYLKLRRPKTSGYLQKYVASRWLGPAGHQEEQHVYVLNQCDDVVRLSKTDDLLEFYYRVGHEPGYRLVINEMYLQVIYKATS